MAHLITFISATLCLIAGIIILFTEGVTAIGLGFFQLVYLMLILDRMDTNESNHSNP